MADIDQRLREAWADASSQRPAIIDIGSNSVRLVVYAGPLRAPVPVFNEKLMVGLGSGLSTSGAIDPKPYRRAIAGLARFHALTRAMGITDLTSVATAAVRDASNGAQFIEDARRSGIEMRLLSGREEARAAGYGVISAIPDADGIVADLGGGSLELVRVRDGATAHHTSLPLGVLRLGALRRKQGQRFAKYIAAMLKEAGWPGSDAGLPLYLVGGSWRALARYHMMLSRDPLPVVSGHVIPIEAVAGLTRRLAALDPASLLGIGGLSAARAPTMPDAAALLVPLVKTLESAKLVVSASGLREGLLYQALPEDVRRQDPLIVAAEAEGRRFARFIPNGREMDAWIAPLFPDDSAADARLRLACCLLADTSSTANPDFRDDRAAEMALHGQWWGIDLADRMVMAQTLFTSVGGQGRPFTAKVDAATERRLARAVQWGLAMRLAERLSGGTAAPFAASGLTRADGKLRLVLSGAPDFGGEQVDKRLRQLADGLGLKAETVA